ncbi:MAG: hypothetical protein ACI9G5_002656 [Paracoccaceae bacterium]|jgi:hypothetical protein
MVSFVDTLASKVAEDGSVMDQIRNNTKEQAMLGDYPSAVETAVIASMEADSDLSMQFLTDKRVSRRVAELLLEVLRNGLQGSCGVVLRSSRSTLLLIVFGGSCWIDNFSLRAVITLSGLKLLVSKEELMAMTTAVYGYCGYGVLAV